ncbi:hypothetical protein Lal_00021410 [Lupinus albus]|nr:hypothetical protein Lal_00021410 [Lupinus albus]
MREVEKELEFQQTGVFRIHYARDVTQQHAFQIYENQQTCASILKFVERKKKKFLPLNNIDLGLKI